MIELVPFTDADFWLTEAFEGDPAMMVHLGGPTPKEQLRARHERRLGRVARGDWWFKIVVDGAGAGGVGIWRREDDGPAYSEMGWMVIPAFQGRGMATAAGRMVLSRARAERRFGPELRAYPNVANAASNAICRALGFTRVGERDLEFNGRPLRAADWRLSL